MDASIHVSVDRRNAEVQVSFDNFSSVTVSHFIRTESSLSSFRGIKSYQGFDRTADCIEKVPVEINYNIWSFDRAHARCYT